ncbi:MAG: glycine C-acetyltransferase [Zhaonellaceae bacterium]|jgi:glycine C-acetyltransferase|nr:glycine C-acetyltransferase [Clostridia bacterium]
MRVDLNEKIKTELETLKKEGTYKRLKYNTGILHGKIPVEGWGQQIVLCSNNYLGLADNEEVLKAAHEALDTYGAGASSVRFICGTYDIHRRLEERLAEFLGMEDSVTYSSCWAANTAVIPTLVTAGDAVISDELNHASIIDGCRLIAKGVKKLIYKHSDMKDLEEKLKDTADCGTVLIVTDGVFSMEGDIAKLPEIVSLAKKYKALVMIDDSHATGVIGNTGRGTMEYYGLTDGVDIISGTFGKALGGAGGGFIAASKNICDLLMQKSRPQLFSNSLPPVLCAIALAAIDYLDKTPGIVGSLRKKVKYCREKIKAAGLNPLEGDSAIIPIIIGDTAKAISIAEEMLKKGVFTIGFGYPVVPEGTARIRLQISDALSYEELDYAIDVLKAAFV